MLHFTNQVSSLAYFANWKNSKCNDNDNVVTIYDCYAICQKVLLLLGRWIDRLLDRWIDGLIEALWPQGDC